ncbi:MAG: WYL domain-containing protein [Clostridia bacterium]|nr:WYL domain-containing protein [Clostridia bacterium]
MIDGKRGIIIYVLQILQHETDEEHKLKQTQILRILETSYGIHINRKTLSGMIRDLKELGYPIEYDEVERGGNTVVTNIYYEHEFVAAELRMLIDSLLFAGNLPYKQSKDLISKLENLSSIHFKSHTKHTINMKESKATNKAFFSNYDIVDRAILEAKKIKFNYFGFDSDFSLIKYTDADGKAREYKVSPYYMTVLNGRYFILCGTPKNKLTVYRLDRMENAEILKERSTPVDECNGYAEGFNLAQYMNKNIYLTPGDIGRVTFRIKKRFLSEVIDWFGDDIQIRDLPKEECGLWGALWRQQYYEKKFASEDPDGQSKEYKNWISENPYSWGRSVDKECEIKVQVNLLDMQLFARQHMDYMRITEPEEFVKLMKADIIEAARNYNIIDSKKRNSESE